MPTAPDGDPDAPVRPRYAGAEEGAHPAGPVAVGRRVAAVDASGHRTGMGRSATWTIVAALLPGLGLLPTRRRKLGIAIFVLAVAALALIAVQARRDLGSVAAIAVRPTWLLVLAVLAGVLAVTMVVLITATHLLTRPRPATPGQRALGAVLVGLLSFVVAAPLGIAANVARTQADLVQNLFKRDGSTRSQTRPTFRSGADPWASQGRVNILLLGGDNSAVRDQRFPDAGIRTDTTMLASIDTATGNTALIQLPRNLEAFPFPAGSRLAAAYPQGFWTGREGDRENPEFELNAVWDNVPRDHPELFANTDYPNADALKSAVEGITGLKPDYFLLLSIDGIQRLIDAMGGVTINVNERIPMGQSKEQFEAGIGPSGGWLEKGPAKHLNGYEAMWYARSRSQSIDSARMARQGCVVDAIVAQANPQNLLTRYDQIANASRNALLTDIPQEMAPAMVELSLRMKDARIKRLLFAYPATKYPDGTPFKPWEPDAATMQQMVQQTITSSMEAPTPSAVARPSTAAPTRTATTATTPSPDVTSPSGTPSASLDPNADLKDACAWHG